MHTLSSAHALASMCKAVYLRHSKFIYLVGGLFYEANHPKAVEAARSFYIRNKIAQPDKDGILEIELSLDGAYSCKGQESTYCISFAMEVWTHRCLDHHVSVKCFLCKNSNLISTNGSCEFGKFHGPTGSMERENAVILFKRSVEKNKMRYTKYVADGDCKIYKALNEMRYGPGIKIQKMECANLECVNIPILDSYK